jgi:hypothetical protein
MFKNRAMYVEMVPKKEISGNPYEPPELIGTPVIETINEIISEQGKNIVKGVVCVIGAYFGFRTVSHIMINESYRRND